MFRNGFLRIFGLLLIVSCVVLPGWWTFAVEERSPDEVKLEQRIRDLEQRIANLERREQWTPSDAQLHSTDEARRGWVKKEFNGQTFYIVPLHQTETSKSPAERVSAQ